MINKTAKRWTREEDVKLCELWGSMSREDIAHALGRGFEAIKKRSQVLGLTKRRGPKHPPVGASNVINYAYILAPMELAEGHFAVDQSSYDALKTALSEVTKRPRRKRRDDSFIGEDDGAR